MNLLVFYTLVLFSNPSLSESNVPSLCEQPIIDAADRLANGSIRVYRGDHYWELEGLPGKEGKVVGPFKVWYPNMLPIDRSTAIQTVINGLNKSTNYWTENTYKFKGDKFWSWFPDGQAKIIAENAVPYKLFPSGQGLYAAFNDQMLDKTNNFPMMIAFQGIRVYYYKTMTFPFDWFGDPNGYNLTGQFGEHFPSDVNAAFAFPSNDPKIKYYVYLFKVGEYCFRPINGNKEENDCETKWRKNEELFGCLKTTGMTTGMTTDHTTGHTTGRTNQTIHTTKHPEEGVKDTPQTATKLPEKPNKNIALSITNQSFKVVMVLMAFFIKLF